MPWTNYHSHSHYCDGKFAPEEHIKAAIQKKFWAFGCSSHAYVPFEASWCMKEEKKEVYVKEIRELAERYKSAIEIYLSSEVDYIPNMVGPNKVKEEMGLDYTVGSVHFVDQFEDGKPYGIDGKRLDYLKGLEKIFHGNVKAAVSRYYELTRQMLEEDCPEVLGHMDKIKMHNQIDPTYEESEDWYQKQVLATLEVAKSQDVIIEVNTRGIYKKRCADPYPSPWILKHIHEMGIPIQLNSDSHHPEDIDKIFTDTAALLHDIGFREMRILYKQSWQNRPFTLEGIQV